MTDTNPKFDPISRLQQIAATIRDSGEDTFDAPATSAYYIECAIEEIERLRKRLLAEENAYDIERRQNETLHELVGDLRNRNNRLLHQLQELEAREQ